MHIKLYGRNVPFCSYCAGAKTFLEQKGQHYEYIDVMTEGFDIAALKSQTHSSSLPQIFIDGTFIGGFDDLKKKWDQILLRDEIQQSARIGNVSVTFNKVDGTERTLIGTLQESVVESYWKGRDKPEPKPINFDTLSLFETESGLWKSFRISSVINWTGP